MTTPVVVQGTPMVIQGTSISLQLMPAQLYDSGAGAGAAPPPPQEWAGKGEKQEMKCHDPFFALLLWGNVGALITLTVVYGLEVFWDEITPGGEYSLRIHVDMLIYRTCALIILAIMSLILTNFPETLINMALIFVVAVSGVWCILSFVYRNIVDGIFGAIFFLIGICYAEAVWSHIPFGKKSSQMIVWHYIIPCLSLLSYLLFLLITTTIILLHLLWLSSIIVESQLY